MLYLEARNYISNIERAGSDYGIERMRELLSLLGSPDKNLKFVHVAGTNGKGSVTAYMTSILIESGYKVTTYNSPSVFDYNERWLISGKPISDEFVAKYLTIIKDAIDKEQTRRAQTDEREFKPTAFEIETALMMLLSHDLGADICVLETGLGGRWDATNVIEDKEIAIITPIGLDHTHILGNTIEEIASEKAAIGKEMVVTCKQSKNILQELAHPFDVVDNNRVYRDVNLIVADDARVIDSDLGGQTFEYNNKVYHICLLGKHQVENASIAVCSATILAKKWHKITDESIRAGLEKARWHARFEVLDNSQDFLDVKIPDGKKLILDGSHNPHGAKTLANGIEQYFKGKTIHYVFGVLKDKDVDGIVDILSPYASKVFCITPMSNRALDKSDLRKLFEKHNVCAVETNDIKSAIDIAFDGCDVVIVCGSLTLFSSLTKGARNG